MQGGCADEFEIASAHESGDEETEEPESYDYTGENTKERETRSVRVSRS